MSYKRGNTWTGDVYLGGGKRRRLGGFASQAEAEAWEAAVKAEASDGQMPVGMGMVTLKMAYDATYARHWRGTKGERTATSNADQCVAYLGADTPVASIDAVMIDEMVAEFARTNASSTVNRKLAALSKILRHSLTRGWITSLPSIERREESEHRIRFLTNDEEIRLLDVTEEAGRMDARDLWMVLLDTGMRAGEALGLRFKDCRDGRVYLWGMDTKGNTSRAIRMTDRVKMVIDRRLRENQYADDPRVFADLSYAAAYYAWDEARKAMGLRDDPYFVIHCLRHTFCSRLVQRGVPLAVVQKLAGHANITTTMRYVHLADEHLDAAMLKLNGSNMELVSV
jgi:integrase